MHGHISERRDGNYVVDMFEGETLETWVNRESIDADNFEPGFDVGDVVELPPDYRRNPIEERAGEELASQISSEIRRFEDHVEAAAEKYNLHLDSGFGSFSDGDVLLLASPPEFPEPLFDEGDRIYSTPQGFLKDGAWDHVQFDKLVRRPDSAIDSGLVFDAFEIGEYLLGLEYNSDATNAAKDEPLEVNFIHASSVSDLGNIGSGDDIKPPVYAQIQEFDEGRYRTWLFDSQSPSSDSFYDSHRCVDRHGDMSPVYQVKDKWVWSGSDEKPLLPVDELYVNDDRLVAVIDRDGETVIPERE